MSNFPGSFSGRPAGSPRQPVRGVGRADPNDFKPEALIDMLYGNSQVEEYARLLLNPELFRDAPPWGLEVMNCLRRLSTEVATHNFALIKRGLLTIEEIQQARTTICGINDKKFKETLERIKRGVMQSPTPPPPSGDPRKSPQ